jgi:hypothetical protein
MQAVGWAATVIVCLIVVAGLVISVRSVPDILRYLRIRRM